MDADPPGRERRRPGPKRKPGHPTGPDEVRRAVLDAGAALFARNGVPRVAIRDIAAEANVHTALIGRYLGRRDEVIDAVFEDVTSQLVAEIDAAPLAPRSFERASIMGAWTVMLSYYASRDVLAPTCAANPCTALAKGIEEYYGADPATARWRAAQIVGSAVGWRLLEPQLMTMSALPDGDLVSVRSDLHLLHNIIGALALPTVDPRPGTWTEDRA